MVQKDAQVMQHSEHPKDKPFADLKWDDLRVFYVVVESGSFRSAADSLDMSVNAVRNRVVNLERRFRELLLIRSEKGCFPTEMGKNIYDRAKRMADFAKSLDSSHSGKDEAPLSGRVSIRITEGLGSFWVMPNLLSFRKRYPKLIIDLQCEMRPADLATYEADLSVQLTMPEDDDAIVTKLGYMHFLGFVSQEYIEEFGEPEWPLKPPHSFVFQVGPQVANDELGKIFDPKALESMTAATTNSSTAHYFAVANGAGIGILPSYSQAVTRKVVPLNIGPSSLKRPIYLVYNRNVKRTGKIDVVIAWLREIFDREKYPWFAEEFIHPDQLEAYLENDDIVALFKASHGLIRL